MKTTTLSTKSRGFTLVELMTVIAVLSVMLVAAAPSLMEFHRNSVLANTVNTLVSSIYRTRSEAMKEGKFAIMIPGGDEGETDHTQWKKGWLIFIDSSEPYLQFDAGDDVVFRQHSVDFPTYIDIEGNGAELKDGTPAIIFNGAGFSRTLSGGFGAMTIEVNRNDVPDERKIEYVRRIKLAETCKLRSCRPKG